MRSGTRAAGVRRARSLAPGAATIGTLLAASSLVIDAVGRAPGRNYVVATVSLDLLAASLALLLASAAVGLAPRPVRWCVGAAGAVLVATLLLRANLGRLTPATPPLAALHLAGLAVLVAGGLRWSPHERRVAATAARRLAGPVLAVGALLTQVPGAPPVVTYARAWTSLLLLAAATVGFALRGRRRGLPAAAAPLAVVALAARIAVGVHPERSWPWIAVLIAALIASGDPERWIRPAWARARARAATIRIPRPRRRRVRLRPRPQPAPLQRWRDLARAEQTVIVALAGIALIALVGATWRAQRLGWHPVGDDAVLAARAVDVGGPHTPLTGLPTSFGDYLPSGAPAAKHPGPILTWWYAPWVLLLGGPAGVMAGAVSVTVGSAALAGWAGLRARGSTGCLLAACLVLVASATAGEGVPFEPLNAYAPAPALAAGLVLAWAAASGVRWALPWAVVALSIPVQSYLPMSATAVAALAGAVACLAIPALRPPPDHGRWRPAVLAALLVAVALWSGPIVDAVADGGGNAAVLARGGDLGSSLGASGAAAAIAWLFSLPPAWRSVDPFRTDDPLDAFATFAPLSLLVLALGAALLARRWRALDLGLRRLVLVAGTATAATATSMVALPTAGVFSYQIGWAATTAAFWWFTAATLVIDRVRDQPGPPERRWPRGMAASAGAVAIAIGVLAWPASLDRYAGVATWAHRTAADLEDQIGEGPGDGGPVTVVPDGRSWEQVIANAVTLGLVEEGREVRVIPELAEHWGSSRGERAGRDGPTLVVIDGWPPGRPAGTELLARSEPAGWDASHQDAVAAAAAARIRTDPQLAIRPELGGIARAIVRAWVPDATCDDLDALQADPAGLTALPDGALAQLLAEGALRAPSFGERDRQVLEAELRETPTEVRRFPPEEADRAARFVEQGDRRCEATAG